MEKGPSILLVNRYYWIVTVFDTALDAEDIYAGKHDKCDVSSLWFLIVSVIPQVKRLFIF